MASLPALAALVLAAAAAALAFSAPGSVWPNGVVQMHLQLGSTAAGLMDGSSGWNQAAEGSLAAWNSQIARVQLVPIRDSSAPIGAGNNFNNLHFSSTVYGKAFGDGTLAVSIRRTIGTRTVEVDVVLNDAVSWNAYAGSLRVSGGAPVYDIRRVTLHEFGHVLGLDHPDDYGQSVTAIMNSAIGNLDTLTADDIAGARALYGPGAAASLFPPRNEALDFRNQLEAKYRDGLRRPATSSYVDQEGDVVWTMEYYRYRVGLCGHATAVARVLEEIDGGPAQDACGLSPTSQLAFPPRQEALDFRNQLELTYRDTLRRAPTSTTVDVEGDVIWIQEYLRYRVNGCAHGDAVMKVFQQIDGLGVQPACR